jgi:heme exporter protein D
MCALVFVFTPTITSHLFIVMGASKTYVWFAIGMVLIFPVGIPLLYMTLLFNQREALMNSKTMFREAQNGHPTTGYLLFLIDAYKVGITLA